MQAIAESASGKFSVIMISLMIMWPVTLAVLGFVAWRMVKNRHWRWIGIDVGVFILAWHLAINISGAEPPLAFMSRYSVENFITYMKVMGVMTATLFVLSVLAFRFMGGSIGKRIAGFRTVRENSAPLGWAQALARSGVLFVLGILILAPGPLVGYLIGHGSEAASLSLLFSAFAFWWFIAVHRGHAGSLRTDLTPLHKWLVKFRVLPMPRHPATAGELTQTRLEKLLGIKTLEPA
jgi:uncharacterized RDD family membrane protein YckC